MDYYGLLGINKCSEDLEIKKAFKRVSIHLIKCCEDDEPMQEVFMKVAEAYEVLKDPKLRAVYDQYGEEGLKGGVPLSSCEYFQPFVYHGDYMKTYEEFYGTKSPYADILDCQFHKLPLYDIPEGRGLKTKMDPFVRKVFCDLEEIYQGCLKKIKLERRELILEASGKTEIKEKIFDIPIKPGTPEGTQIVFPEAGDQGPTVVPSDVIFVVTDNVHPLYRREGPDLIMTVRLSVKDALTGTTISLRTLDNRKLCIPIHEVIRPGYEKVVRGEGMCDPHDLMSHGDIILRFDILFPLHLPRHTKKLIRDAFETAPEDVCSGHYASELPVAKDYPYNCYLEDCKECNECKDCKCKMEKMLK